jgi:CRP-like cAMP-binding protein
VCRYEQGEVVFSEGDAGESLYVVVEGLLKAFSRSLQGQEWMLAIIGPGESLGELALVDGWPRSASVTALTDATLLELPRDAVMTVASDSPGVSASMVTELASVVRRLTGSAADLVFLDVRRRVAKTLLLQHRSTEGGRLHRRLTQAELASAVGASRQSVNEALQYLRRRGWITSDGSESRICDVEAIRAFVSS